MDKMVITGGERLMGEVAVSGSKNAALPLLAASILTDAASTIRGVPRLRDISTFRMLLGLMGVKFDGDDTLAIDASGLKSCEAPYELVRTMRASMLVLGPLVARCGYARVSLPGGCAIGARPVDFHLKALEALGAKITLVHGYIEAHAGRLRGARIVLESPSVGATENTMMAATLAQGETRIENAAREPEIAALADFLRSMGAKITGDGTEAVVIEGVSALGGGDATLIPDRIEAGTLMVAAGITRGNILLKNCRLAHLGAVADKLRATGMAIEPEDGAVRCVGPAHIASADLTTQVYPGFPTDMQAQFMALMCVADGISVISERIFENRFMHVLELQRMGADIQVQGSAAVVRGVPMLSGADVMATDLRASASLILAGLAASGKTSVHRIYHLDRGYETIEKKLSALGANVKREKEA